jgi:hypothetical protein
MPRPFFLVDAHEPTPLAGFHPGNMIQSMGTGVGFQFRNDHFVL